MAAAFVRALATVLLMGRVAVLDRYRAVLVARLPSCSLHPRTVARLPSCSLYPWAVARPLAVRAASLQLGASARSPARPCRRPRVPQLPACRRGALPPSSGTAVGACCMVATPPAPASFPPLHPCWQSVWLYTYKIAGTKRSRRFTVGVAGFEPTASSSRTKRATKLRHTPVPNEYSHTSSENPNRDRRTMGSVCHAAKMSVR